MLRPPLEADEAVLLLLSALPLASVLFELWPRVARAIEVESRAAAAETTNDGAWTAWLPPLLRPTAVWRRGVGLFSRQQPSLPFHDPLRNYELESALSDVLMQRRWHAAKLQAQIALRERDRTKNAQALVTAVHTLRTVAMAEGGTHLEELAALEELAMAASAELQRERDERIESERGKAASLLQIRTVELERERAARIESEREKSAAALSAAEARFRSELDRALSAKEMEMEAKLGRAPAPTAELSTPLSVPGAAAAVRWACSAFELSAAELSTRVSLQLPRGRIQEEELPLLGLLCGRAARECCPRLRELRLRNVPLSLGGLKRLVDALAGGAEGDENRVSALDLHGCLRAALARDAPAAATAGETLAELIKCAPYVTEIEAGGADLRAGVAPIARALTRCSHLGFLGLAAAHVDADGAAKLASAIRTNGELFSIDLRHNGLGRHSLSLLRSAADARPPSADGERAGLELLLEPQALLEPGEEPRGGRTPRLSSKGEPSEGGGGAKAGGGSSSSRRWRVFG